MPQADATRKTETQHQGVVYGTWNRLDRQNMSARGIAIAGKRGVAAVDLELERFGKVIVREREHVDPQLSGAGEPHIEQIARIGIGSRPPKGSEQGSFFELVPIQSGRERTDGKPSRLIHEDRTRFLQSLDATVPAIKIARGKAAEVEITDGEIVRALRDVLLDFLKNLSLSDRSARNRPAPAVCSDPARDLSGRPRPAGAQTMTAERTPSRLSSGLRIGR
jgi:hypothetical protein